MSFGRTAAGWNTSAFYQPGIEDFVFDLLEAREAEVNPHMHVPVPIGWTFEKDGDEVVIQPSEYDFARFKKLFGFVANFRGCTSDDTASPFAATVVVKLPFKYGTRDSENQFSWVYARTNAFASKAVFFKLGGSVDKKQIKLAKIFPILDPFCIPNLYQTIRIGGAISGAVSSTGKKSTHLHAWQACSFTEWKEAFPASSHPEGICLPTDGIFKLPVLGHLHLPTHAVFCYFRKSKISSKIPLGPAMRILFQPDRTREIISDGLEPPPDFSRGPKIAAEIAAKVIPKAPPAHTKAPPPAFKPPPRETFTQRLDRFGLLKVPLEQAKFYEAY